MCSHLANSVPFVASFWRPKTAATALDYQGHNTKARFPRWLAVFASCFFYSRWPRPCLPPVAYCLNLCFCLKKLKSSTFSHFKIILICMCCCFLSFLFILYLSTVLRMDLEQLLLCSMWAQMSCTCLVCCRYCPIVFEFDPGSMTVACLAR